MKQFNGIIRISIVPIMLLISGVSVRAQYAGSGITLEKTYGSAVNWVDIDSDGDLDLTISGYYFLPSSARGKLYLNNGTTLVFNSDIRLMQDGDETWCDFNRDGNPDMLYAGKFPTNAYSAGIDVFDISGGFTWSGLSAGFVPVVNASVDWGDFDNDGDYDALISGEDAQGYVLTRIYRNDNSVFSDINPGIPGVTEGKVVFIDYDLDEDLDIFISGLDVNLNKYTRLWKNDNGIFSITGDTFVNLKYSQADWGDFNNDGYPDLLVGGFDNTSLVGYIYLNNSGGSFTLSPVAVPGCYQGSSGFGDVDNDGDLDVFISGKKQDSGLDQKFIYINNGAGALVPSDFLSTAVTSSFFQFGDWNKDNKLDFVVNGYTPTGGLTVIANNNSGTANSPPSSPSGLTAAVTGRNVRLSWSNSTDNNTSQNALTYNIYIGTSSKGINVVSPNADVVTGFRKISRQGYIQGTSWTIRNLSAGTYYWGVQAIDNSLGASSFSDEGTFEIKDRFSLVSYTEDPSVSSPAVYFDADHDNDLDMFLNDNSTFYAVENTLVPFTQANYKTISSTGYNPIKTITPNDYNNNNKIDFSVSGFYMGTGILDSSIALYGFNTPFNYNLIKEALVKNLDFEYAIWADLNNDGLQDLITSGKTTNLITGNKPATYIYRNMGSGSFQKVTRFIRGFEKCGAVDGDFDNDMDIDFVVYGKDSTGTANTYIYVNQGNFNFTETLIPGNALYRAYLSYGIFTGDYDQNGELDIYMAGEDPTGDFHTRVLLNHGMNFSDANLALRSTPKMSNYWADYDYDGDIDIFYSSINATPTDKLRLYINNNGSLDELTIDLGAKQLIDLPLMAVNLDNKNGLDFILKRNSVDYLFYQYYDNWGSGQPILPAPANAGFDQDKLDIILKWDKLSDCPSCTYNIRVGTTPGGVDIMSPMADKNTGYRYVVQPGNSYADNGWKLSDLTVGTYYWSVQGVDPSNTGGPWTTESTFIVSHTDADFTFTTVCSGDSTSFTDQSVSTSQIIKWKWEFGDGTISRKQDPNHLYTSSGTFTAGLWAYSESGDSAYQSYPVLVKAVPAADFSANIACQGTPTTFTNNTDINGLTITSWSWDFGDTGSSTQQNPGTHGYLNPGDYLVKLTVTADNGCSDQVTRTVTLAANPDAGITASGLLTFCKGDSVTLSVPYNNKYSYNWMVGGTSLTGGNGSNFTAKLSGNYTVEVTNSTGNCKTTSSVVAVAAQDAPVAPLISADRTTEFCQDDSVTLSVTNTSGYVYHWKLNGGTVGTNSNEHTAKVSGLFSLTVANVTGCRVDATNTINVTVNQKPDLSSVSISGPTTFCQGLNVELSVTNNPALTYQWQENGANISGSITNTYTAISPGIYSLRILNANNCSITTDNVTVNVLTVPAAPAISASGDLQFCQGDSVILSVQEVSGYNYQWRHNGGSVGSNSSQLIVRNSGNYDIVVSNSSGCTAVSSNGIDITVNPLPAARSVSLSGSTAFCEGGRVILSVSSLAGFDYNWSNEDGLITGANTSSYIASTTGKYQLGITDSNGCVYKTTPVNVVVKPAPVSPEIDPGTYVSDKCPGDNAIRLSAKSTVTDYQYQWYKDGLPVRDATLSYLEIYEQGNYRLEANLGGCSAGSDVLIISFPEAPPKPFIYTQGPNVWYLVCSNTKASGYKWYCNEKLIEDADKYYYVANRKMGDYQVSIGNDQNCYTRSDIVTIPTGATGTDNIDPFEGLRIYPNPTTGLFTIEMDNWLFGELSVSIITEDGKLISSLKLEKSEENFSTEIDAGNQPKGLYFINLAIEKYFATRKIIVE